MSKLQWRVTNDKDCCDAGCRWYLFADDVEPCSICSCLNSGSGYKCLYDAELIPPKADEKQTVNDAKQSTKDTAGKPMMRLILPNATTAIVRAREFGLKKYPDAENWRGVDNVEWIEAALRHIFKHIAGEELDDESGLPHLWHALCSLGYAVEQLYPNALWELHKGDK